MFLTCGKTYAIYRTQQVAISGVEMKTVKKGLISMVYPGRMIVLGRDVSGTKNIVLYIITGRSPSSQAREIVWEKDSFWVKPTDKDIIKTGNIDLLVYPSLFAINQGVAVSNGKQTVDILASLSHSRSASEILAFSLQKWEYEPDGPTFTPRISGCLLSSESAALSLIRRYENGSSIRNIYEFPLIKGKGCFISTYTGENSDPLPSFNGEPVEVNIKETSPQKVAENLYDGLAPDDPNKDFRVSVACLFINRKKTDKFEYHIINRKDRI
jgi:IMP cyclohydrolase